MRFPIFIAAAIFSLTSPASAQANYSQMIRDTGLAATETALSALPDKTPSDMFALGGVRFLGAVEGALQSLYATQINREMAEMSGLPFLRLSLPPNPDAVPFRPELIAETYQAALVDLQASLDALDAITDTDAVAVTINTGDLWFDINANGTRDLGEGMLESAGAQRSALIPQTRHGFRPMHIYCQAWVKQFWQLIQHLQ